MLIKIKCTCGKPISRHFVRVQAEMAKHGMDRLRPSDPIPDFRAFFESIGIKRYCCRSELISSLNYVLDMN